MMSAAKWTPTPNTAILIIFLSSSAVVWSAEEFKLQRRVQEKQKRMDVNAYRMSFGKRMDNFNTAYYEKPEEYENVSNDDGLRLFVPQQQPNKIFSAMNKAVLHDRYGGDLNGFIRKRMDDSHYFIGLGK